MEYPVNKFTCLIIIFVLVLSVITPPLIVKGDFEDDVSSTSDKGIESIIIQNDHEVVIEEVASFRINLDGDVSNTTLEYNITCSEDQAYIEGIIEITEDVDHISFDEDLGSVFSTTVVITHEIEVELQDGEDTLDTASKEFNLGWFVLSIFARGGVSAESISSDEELKAYMEGTVFMGTEGWFSEEEIELSIYSRVTISLRGEEEDVVQHREHEELDPSKAHDLFFNIGLIDGDVENVVIQMYGEIEEETKYGIGPLKMGFGGDITAYGSLSFEYDYQKEVSKTMDFVIRPFVMYSGEDVLDSSHGTVFTGSGPELYDYPSMMHEFEKWNSQISFSHIPPIGNNDAGGDGYWPERFGGWVRLLPQPLVIGYEHFYTPPDTTIRLIGGGRNLPGDLSVSIEGEGEVFSANDEDVIDNNAYFNPELSEGEYTFIIEGESRGAMLEFKQDFYVYDGVPNSIRAVNANSDRATELELNVSREIKEPGWGVSSLDNSENFNIDDEGIGELDDVSPILDKPDESLAKQSPYSSISPESNVEGVSHYKLAVCNIYRPYDLFAYVLVGDDDATDRSDGSDYTWFRKENGEVRGTRRSSHRETHTFLSLYGEPVDLQTHVSDYGLLREDVLDKAENDGYEHFVLSPPYPSFDVSTDQVIYEDGDEATVFIDLDLDSVNKTDLEEGVVTVTLIKESVGHYGPVKEEIDITLDENGKGSATVEAVEGAEYRVMVEGTDYLYITNAAEVPITVGGIEIFNALLRGFGFVSIIATFLVIYKGYASIFADKKWNISEFIQKFIEGEK